MATFTTMAVDGAWNEKNGDLLTGGNISHQSALNSDVIFSAVNHGLTVNQPISFIASTGTNSGGNALLPANITAGTVYYVKPGYAGSVAGKILAGVANNFQVSATPGGTEILWGSGFQGAVASPGHVYTPYTSTVSGTTVTVDLAAGNFFEIDLQPASGDIATFTISNPSGTHISTFGLKITQGSTARQITWASLSAFKWIGGNSGRPTLTTTDNAVDILSFTTYDNGTTWYGAVVGQNYS